MNVTNGTFHVFSIGKQTQSQPFATVFYPGEPEFYLYEKNLMIKGMCMSTENKLKRWS